MSNGYLKKGYLYDTCYICGDIKVIFTRTCGKKKCREKDSPKPQENKDEV